MDVNSAVYNPASFRYPDSFGERGLDAPAVLTGAARIVGPRRERGASNQGDTFVIVPWNTVWLSVAGRRSRC